jgi:Beta-lactamase
VLLGILRNGGSLKNLEISRIREIVYCQPGIAGFQLSIRSSNRENIDLCDGITTGLRAMTASHLHQCWCLTKPVLALSAVLSHKAGLVDLSAKCSSLSRYATGLSENSATLWDVLCHDAGLASPTSVDIWMSPRKDRIGVLALTRASEKGMAAYSDFAGWALIGRRLDECYPGGLRALIDSTLTLLGVGVESIILDGSRADSKEVRDRLGVYFAHMSGRSPIPLLHDLIPHVMRSVSPVMGGLATASGVADFYWSLMTNAEVSESVRAMFQYQRGAEWDVVLERECNFGAGLMVDLRSHGFGERVGPSSFGHTGWLGSSFGIADPSRQVALCLIHNGFIDSKANDRQRVELLDYLYAEL